MKNILITGATGNVGLEIIKSFSEFKHTINLFAGVRDLEKDKLILSNYDVPFTKFDFTDKTTYTSALNNCDVLFLLRPPQLSEVNKYFKPLIEIAKQKGVQHIVFLSVQGVENSRIIPHHKIEKLIVESNIPFTFIRPAYFMQNFTTTLKNDLVNKQRIFLPAGNSKFTLVDVCDVGRVVATVLSQPGLHKNKSYELTSYERLSFEEMAAEFSKEFGKPIHYESPNLLSFFIEKRKEQVPTAFILVMIMLHYFPRFQKVPEISKWVETITGKPPISFNQFINRNLEAFNV